MLIKLLPDGFCQLERLAVFSLLEYLLPFFFHFTLMPWGGPQSLIFYVAAITLAFLLTASPWTGRYSVLVLFLTFFLIFFL